MRDLLDRLLGKKTPDTILLELEDFPKIFHERESENRAAFAASAAEPIRAIRNAEAQLRHIVNTIEGAEHDPELHPKLKSIAKNTLPQYVRSMNSALAKELPEDPEEFYAASVEMVKGCLNSIRGPGRYLQIVFPEEMKASRKGIDAIGVKINALTQFLGTYRSAMTALHEARSEYETLARARTDLAKAAEKESRIGKRCNEISGRLADIERELTSLHTDPLTSDAETRKNALHAFETQRDETARTYASFSMTASHVFRKAEKIAAKQKHTGEITMLRHAMALLSDHELPDPADLEQALADACPIASRMIESGEIPLKNREERTIFTDTERFRSEMGENCRRLIVAEKECQKAAEELTLHPAVAKHNSLQKEKAQLSLMLAKEQAALADLMLFKEKTRNGIPLLTKNLRQKTGVIMGKNVQVQDKDKIPA